MLSCYIVDDENASIDILEDYIKETPWLKLVGTNSQSINGLAEFLTLNPIPDILFLDIDMPVMSGIQFSEIVKDKTNIIFCTAYKEYGPEAFKVNAIDYLLKPFTYNQFLNATTKVYKSGSKTDRKEDDRLFICVNNDRAQKVNINANEIVQINGLSNYFKIQVNSGKCYTYYGKLKDIIHKLETLSFVRCHKSHIVNLKEAEVISENIIYMKNGSKIPIGNTYRSSLRERIEMLLRG